LLALATAGLIALGWRYASRRWPMPCPAALGWFLESGIRERLLPTRWIVERLGMRPGLRVLEVGPGVGYLSVPVARALGPSGRLVALELQPAMAERTRQRVGAAGLTNVEVRQGDATNAPLERESYDLAFLVTVLGEIPDRDAAIANLRDALEPGGL